CVKAVRAAGESEGRPKPPITSISHSAPFEKLLRWNRPMATTGSIQAIHFFKIAQQRLLGNRQRL
ncbi:hypothetical protein, partial [Pseudomonas fragi]|uniref:hypothetical protein n=1 Tax=Pseudomonas fragi TaxID=296 RepID=UPI0028E75C7B